MNDDQTLVRVAVDLPRDVAGILQKHAEQQHRSRKAQAEWILSKYAWELAQQSGANVENKEIPKV